MQLPKVCGLIGIALLLSTSAVWAQGNKGKPITSSSPESPGKGKRPNILFIIMDDVGIDQMTAFGYGGVDPANTPNINAIAQAGVRFRNVWAMPECSPSRAMFFEGRYALRTKIFSAILPNDLANSQVSPFEYTTPKLLKAQGYSSADFGKFHLAISQNNPFNNSIVSALGWDYFDGFLDGAPRSIDTTAGGIGAVDDNTGQGPYSCGFVPNAIRGGADQGACYFVDHSCQLLATPAYSTPGRSCMEQGGVFVPNATTCRKKPPAKVNFELLNAYYVWSRFIDNGTGKVVSMPYQRGYMGEATTNSAVAWINGMKNANKNWMATVAYPQIHTPYQQAPESLVASAALSNLNCTPNVGSGIPTYHLLSNQMLESMDIEIGRLLVQTGLATYNPDGSLNYQPEKTNAMVVIIGDNGTYAAGVKFLQPVPPGTPQPSFVPSESKGTVYQTGVWVPLIVAGPMVNTPNRDVNAQVNVADLFQLWGEIAGVDVHKAVPASHILDSQNVLPYLTNPSQTEIRQTNFTQTGNNIHPKPPSPCVLDVTTPPTCIQLFPAQSICENEGGIWYGPGTGVTQTFTSCCAVKNANLYPDGLTILPDYQNAIRNDLYKLIQKEQPDCSQQPDKNGVFPDVTLREFYQIDEAEPIPQIDRPGSAKCADTLGANGVTQNCPTTLSPPQSSNYNNLLDSMTQLLESEPECPGDGNEDKVVNRKDIHYWKLFAKLTDGGSSWYDFNFDGLTDDADLAIIQEHLGTRCLHSQ